MNKRHLMSPGPVRQLSAADLGLETPMTHARKQLELVRQLRDLDAAGKAPLDAPMIDRFAQLDLSLVARALEKAMSLTEQDRHTLDHDAPRLTDKEAITIQNVFNTLYSSGLSAAKDDRAAALEAALIRYILASRKENDHG